MSATTQKIRNISQNDLYSGSDSASGSGGVGNRKPQSSSKNYSVMMNGASGGCSPSRHQQFDVNRLTGLSPTSRMASNHLLPLPSIQRNNGRLDEGIGFQWPEKIHGSTIKQQDTYWLQQQQHQKHDQLFYQQQPQHPDSLHGYHEFCGRNDQCPSSTLTSATSSDSDQYQFESSDYVPARIPPSPAP